MVSAQICSMFGSKGGSNGAPVSLQIRQVRVQNERDGCNCCGVCRVCTCIKWAFIFSPLGAIKVAELVSQNCLVIAVSDPLNYFYLRPPYSGAHFIKFINF